MWLLSLLALARAASLLSSPGGPSEAGLYISPVTYTHRLDGPAFSSPSHWYFTQWDAPDQVNASEAVAGCPGRPNGVWSVSGNGIATCVEKQDGVRAGGAGIVSGC